MLSIRSLGQGPVPVLDDVPPPVPGPGQVVVEVTAAAINPADTFVLSGIAGAAFGLPTQVGLGYDLAGTVHSVGEGVSSVSVGDRVAGLHEDLAASSRAQADLVVVPGAAVAGVPDDLDLVAAATVPLGALTACQALDLLGEPAGRTLLVTGAAGAVGGYAAALASARGWRVIGLARARDRDQVTGAGAELVTELPERCVDAVLDAAALQEDALAAVVDDGHLVGVLPPLPVTPERGIEVATVDVRADGVALGDLLSRTASGELPPRVAGTFPFASAAEAYARFAEGGHRGRWVLTR